MDNNYQIETKVLQCQILIPNVYLNKAWVLENQLLTLEISGNKWEVGNKCAPEKQLLQQWSAALLYV